MSPPLLQTPTPGPSHETPTQPTLLLTEPPRIHVHATSHPRRSPDPAAQPSPTPRLPPIGCGIESHQAEAEEITAPATVPAEEQPSPPQTNLPPIHGRTPPSPRRSPSPINQPTLTPHLPPIGQGFEPHRTAGPIPRGPLNITAMISNPNKPPEWGEMSKVKRDNWNKRNKIPAGPSTPTPTPETQIPSPPNPKPDNWSTLSKQQKQRWRDRNE